MNLDQDRVPTNLDEAVELLIESLTPSEIKAIKDPKFCNQGFHFTLGMGLRNQWSMWHKDTILVQWFYKTYGIDHADDISSIILDCCFRDIRGETRRDKKLAKHYIERWKQTT